MARRFPGSTKEAKGRSDGRQFRARDPKEARKRALLDISRLYAFKYDLKELLESERTEQEVASSFTATIIAKASNISINDAKDYIREMEGNNKITKRASAGTMRLLDIYTRYR